jgi:hypothetical protein
MNDEETTHWEELVDAARRYGVGVESSTHCRGTAN